MTAWCVRELIAGHSMLYLCVCQQLITVPRFSLQPAFQSSRTSTVPVDDVKGPARTVLLPLLIVTVVFPEFLPAGSSCDQAAQSTRPQNAFGNVV
jgi:hypothetical protein